MLYWLWVGHFPPRVSQKKRNSIQIIWIKAATETQPENKNFTLGVTVYLKVGNFWSRSKFSLSLSLITIFMLNQRCKNKAAQASNLVHKLMELFTLRFSGEKLLCIVYLNANPVYVVSKVVTQSKPLFIENCLLKWF